MVFTLVVYFFFRDLRNSCRNNIHKNLISNMILFNITFIFGIDAKDNVTMCKVVAILLHYLLLTSLLWMMSEAVYLYYKVIRISPIKGNTLATYMGICYLLPLVIVVPVATINFDTMYDIDKICWLSQVGRWTVVIPCALIVMFNLIVLVRILVIVRERASGHKVKGRTVRQEENKQMKKTVQGCITLQPILGLTWILGPFTSHIVIAYVFTITSALQGFFIFIVYCVYDKEVKSAWRKWKKNQPKNNVIHTSSGTLPDLAEPTKDTIDVDMNEQYKEKERSNLDMKEQPKENKRSNLDTRKERKNELLAMAGKPAWR
ncbi:adhesion G protein-coupled receptor L4-like isoform X2 [Anneissia japonica]|uniref:adhesion G protein-coupled receptor L4-like isoform X2 n=1 Tax=Anneissia japonica TaxID=1529436 RepID=UPI0014258368|nr:adhesion G protein-coupled receptor L4-like isoform X2 [Anneissia japonica]